MSSQLETRRANAAGYALDQALAARHAGRAADADWYLKMHAAIMASPAAVFDGQAPLIEAAPTGGYRLNREMKVYTSSQVEEVLCLRHGCTRAEAERAMAAAVAA
ncbi:hypothetical protein GCM10027294_26020 [Marinactinospora endophytica]